MRGLLPIECLIYLIELGRDLEYQKFFQEKNALDSDLLQRIRETHLDTLKKIGKEGIQDLYQAVCNSAFYRIPTVRKKVDTIVNEYFEVVDRI